MTHSPSFGFSFPERPPNPAKHFFDPSRRYGLGLLAFWRTRAFCRNTSVRFTRGDGVSPSNGGGVIDCTSLLFLPTAPAALRVVVLDLQYFSLVTRVGAKSKQGTCWDAVLSEIQTSREHIVSSEQRLPSLWRRDYSAATLAATSSPTNAAILAQSGPSSPRCVSLALFVTSLF